MNTLELDQLGEDTPPQDCYNQSERDAHQKIRAHVMAEVLEASFDSFTFLIGNYDFAFDISSTHEHYFLLKVRCGDLAASHDFALPECAVEAAMAAYRLLVCLPRTLQQGEEPCLILIDANGQTLRDSQPEPLEASLEIIQHRTTVFEGKYLSARIIPVVGGLFITEVFHHPNGAMLLADYQFPDFDLAKRFVNFYMTHADTEAYPQYPEALCERARAIIMN